MFLDKRQHLCPGIAGGFSVISGAAVEEAMGGAFVDHNLMIDPGLVEILVELLNLLNRDTLVSAAEEAQERIASLDRQVQNRRAAAGHLPAQARVEADCT